MLLIVVGATLLSGMAQAVVAGLGALIILVIFIRALSTHDYSHGTCVLWSVEHADCYCG